MRGVKFQTMGNDSRSWRTADDWGLVMTSKSIGVPPIKERYIELKDRDGDLDLTDALTGYPAYGTRTLSFGFEYLDDPKKWTEVFTNICGTLHGKRLMIFEPDDPTHYFAGRVSVGEPSGGLVKSFAVTVKADAWRYIYPGQIITFDSIKNDQTLIVTNSGQKSVCPTILALDAVTFEFDGVIYSISTGGEHSFPGIRLVGGDNKIHILQTSGTFIEFWFAEGVI